MLQRLTRLCNVCNINRHQNVLNALFQRRFAQMTGDNTLESMSLLQYGDRQIYLFGIDSDSDDPNMKTMINDLEPDHIFFGICQDRADKLLDNINKTSGNYYSPLNCEMYITPDLPDKTKYKWKTTSVAKDVMNCFGLIYGNQYYDTLNESKKRNLTFSFGDKSIKNIMEIIEEFMKNIEDDDAIQSSQKKKAIEQAAKNVGRQPKGRQKASKSFYARSKSDVNVDDKEGSGIFDHIIDILSDLNTIDQEFPEFYQQIVESRDDIMFENLKNCQGNVIFAVVPSIHTDGITNKLLCDSAIVLM